MIKFSDENCMVEKLSLGDLGSNLLNELILTLHH